MLETIGILARPAEGGSLYDRFKGRLLFSIRDAQGRPVGIGGRVLPELGTTSPAKYVNSPETPLFTKSKLLYGLDLAREALRKTRTALVMEGYTDVIVAHQYGFQNAVAVLGTALGESHIRILKRHADRIVLVLDGDEAGTQAGQRGAGIVRRPAGRSADPDAARRSSIRATICTSTGPRRFRELLADQGGGRLGPRLRGDHPRDRRGARHPRRRPGDRAAAGDRGQGPAAERRNAGRRADSGAEDRAAAGGQVPRGRAGVAAAIDRAAAAASAAHSREPAACLRPGEWPRAELNRRASEAAGGDRRVAARVAGIADRPSASASSRCEVASRPEQLAAEPCRRIYETCCRLADAGVVPAFDRLMLEFDEPAMKNLLVELDESGQAKGRPAADPDGTVGRVG